MYCRHCCCSASELDLGDNELSTGLSHLRAFSALRVLKLDNNNLARVEELQVVQDMPQLEVLTLNGNDFPQDELQEFVDTLKHRRGLKFQIH